MDVSPAWVSAKNLIVSGAQISDVKDAISALTKHEIENTYEEGQNLLHFAISKNNLEVVTFLLYEKHLFLLPHQPETLPYEHVACFYGFSDTVGKLMVRISSENIVKISAEDKHWKRFLAMNCLTGVFHDKKEISAYKIAALRQHGACIEALLWFCSRQELLGQLIELGELEAMHFLLDAKKCDPYELNYGLECSLLAVSPYCLEVILKYAVHHGIYFAQRNPYHVLYAYGKNGAWTTGDPVAECTRLLVSYGWDVNVLEAEATFPLYSLLRHILNYNESGFYEREPHELEAHDELQTLDEELVCFSELLAAGANPDLDEKSNVHEEFLSEFRSVRESRLEKRFKSSLIPKDRPAFSTVAEALAAIICPKTANTCMMDFVSRSAAYLVKYGHSMKGQRSWLRKMIEVDQAVGLNTLLNTMDFHLDALNYGFEKSLHQMSPRCLETMVQYDAKHSITYRQKDPLHFVYLCASLLDLDKPFGIAKCTHVLVSHGWDVNGMHAQASYPLYTLLWCVWHACAGEDMYYQDWAREAMEEGLTCLRLLLTAGADPNFDETSGKVPNLPRMPVSAIEASVLNDCQNPCPKYGRKPWSSAAAVMVDMLKCEELTNVSLDFMVKSVTLLVHHGSDMSYVDHAGQSILHLFMQNTLVTLEYYLEDKKGELQAHIRKLLSQLLTSGADIQGRDQSFKLPLTYFAQKLSENMSWFVLNFPRDEGQLEPLSAVLKPMIRLLDVMEMKEAHEIATECMDALEYSALCGDIHATVLDGLKKEILSHLRVRSLFDLCSIKMWRYCGCKLVKTQDLELPLNIKQSLNEMLSF